MVLPRHGSDGFLIFCHQLFSPPLSMVSPRQRIVPPEVSSKETPCHPFSLLFWQKVLVEVLPQPGFLSISEAFHLITPHLTHTNNLWTITCFLVIPQCKNLVSSNPSFPTSLSLLVPLLIESNPKFYFSIPLFPPRKP